MVAFARFRRRFVASSTLVVPPKRRLNAHRAEPFSRALLATVRAKRSYLATLDLNETLTRAIPSVVPVFRVQVLPRTGGVGRRSEACANAAFALDNSSSRNVASFGRQRSAASCSSVFICSFALDS